MESPMDVGAMSGSTLQRPPTDPGSVVEQFRGTFVYMICIENNALSQTRGPVRSLNPRIRPRSVFEREHVPLAMRSVYAHRHESPTG